MESVGVEVMRDEHSLPRLRRRRRFPTCKCPVIPVIQPTTVLYACWYGIVDTSGTVQYCSTSVH
eukprot:scaffold638_cov168-Amphora_coffeaeformis.AAC.4